MSDEGITILRYQTATDAYGDPIPGTYEPHITVSGKVAPSNPSEPVEVGRNAVITGGTIYIRHGAALDITNEDRVRVRGVDYEIDGEVGVWKRRTEYGHQLAFKKIGEGS